MKGFEIKKNVSGNERLSDDRMTNEKERLFDLLIHDLTSPLAIVSTSADHLLQKTDRHGPLTDQQRRMIDRILRNAHKAQKLLEEMVEILRSEEGLFQKEFFSIEEILRESLLDVLEMCIPNAVERLCQVINLEELQNNLKEHGIFVEITGKYCRTSFYHDQNKIQQILRNLMSNAMKYRRERMRVNISGEADLAILVEDDGMGIPPEEREAVFAPFVQLKDQRNSNTPGLGFGLAGVKTLVETMGGEIEWESREGTGTRFIVRIPPHSSVHNAIRSRK